MRALIIVDVQNDFLPGGALAVPEGDQILPLVNDLQEQFDLIVATQDWHPSHHGSFASNHPGKNLYDWVDLNGLKQVLWPVHCVQESPGAEFHPDLNTHKIGRVFRKGSDPVVDSYSGFFDNGRRNSTGLNDFLKEKGVTEVFVVGLATDYCVKFTALDAASLGFSTFVVQDACRAVNVNPGDEMAAIEQMKAAGVELFLAREVPGLLAVPERFPSGKH